MAWTQENWVAAWRASGLSGTRFAEQHGLKAATLYRWARRIDEGVAGDDDVVAFAEVRVRPSVEAPARDAAIEIVASNGRVVRVRGPVDVEVLRSVLEAVERC